MIALPKPGAARRWEIPDHLLTIEEYAALGETEVGYTELVEGRVVTSPNPDATHNLAAFSLAGQLAPSCHPSWPSSSVSTSTYSWLPATNPASRVVPTC